MDAHYDLLVIGGGSGGLAAAKRAAAYGARVALVSREAALGGTCVNVGCVPKKVMWNAAQIGDALEDASGYGFQMAGVSFDWATLKARRAEYVGRLNGVHSRNLDEAGVTVVPGEARFTGPRAVAVGDQNLTADHVVVATGGRPWVPDIKGADLGITSDGFFELEELPSRVAVVGAGYIAVEVAGLLNNLGAEVTMLLRGQHLLGGFDPLVRETLMDEMGAAGVNFLTCINLERLERDGEGVTLVSGDDHRTGPFDQVLWATGRTPATEPLEPDAAGLQLAEDGSIPVDAAQATNVPGIHAVGDVTGRAPLTPVAIKAGRTLADRLFGGQAEACMDYTGIPSVVFSHPPIATVGLTEEEAEEQYGQGGYGCHTTTFRDMYYALLERKVATAMKVITVGPRKRVVGIHVIGRGADEMIQGFAVAMKAGATLEDLHNTVAIHPTASEELVLID